MFRIKIVEKEEANKRLDTQLLINNFQNFDYEQPSELKTGIFQIFQYESHACERNETKIKEYIEKKEGICFRFIFLILIGVRRVNIARIIV